MNLNPGSWIALRSTKVMSAFGHFVGYLLWILMFRLLVLTLVTYLLMSSDAKFQDISELYGANELFFAGIASLLFVLTLRWLNPLTSTSWTEIGTFHRLKKKFGPGFVKGAIIAFGLSVAFVLTGKYRYLGFFIQIDDAWIGIASLGLRVLCIFFLVYAEEFLFRQKILNGLRAGFPDWFSILLTALFFVIVKTAQFDLGLSQLLTLFLISISLSLKTIVEGDFNRAAGIWCGILVLAHAFLSLPIFGAEFQGVILLRYERTLDDEEGLLRILTGGLGGPLSSLGLQLLFLIDIGQSIINNKKILLNRQKPRLK